ncbi:hypothetical protein HK097_002125, partial [Rhizophlyctis rosea]
GDGGKGKGVEKDADGEKGQKDGEEQQGGVADEKSMEESKAKEQPSETSHVVEEPVATNSELTSASAPIEAAPRSALQPHLGVVSDSTATASELQPLIQQQSTEAVTGPAIVIRNPVISTPGLGSMTETSNTEMTSSLSDVLFPPALRTHLENLTHGGAGTPSRTATLLGTSPINQTPSEQMLDSSDLMDDIQNFAMAQKAQRGRRRASTVSGALKGVEELAEASSGSSSLPRAESKVKGESKVEKEKEEEDEADEDGLSKKTGKPVVGRDRAPTIVPLPKKHISKPHLKEEVRRSLPTDINPEELGLNALKDVDTSSLPAVVSPQEAPSITETPPQKWQALNDIPNTPNDQASGAPGYFGGDISAEITPAPSMLNPTTSCIIQRTETAVMESEIPSLAPSLLTQPILSSPYGYDPVSTTDLDHPSEPPSQQLPPAPIGLQRAGKSQSSPALLFQSEPEPPKILYPEAPQLLLIPINGTFDVTYLDLTYPHRFGRSNTQGVPHFKFFPSQVVSRNHAEIMWKDQRVWIWDIGSNSGTFVNGTRIAEAGVSSQYVELKSGDYVQLGRDFVEETPGMEQTNIGGAVVGGKEVVVDDRHKCIKMQILLIPATTEEEQPEVPIINIEEPAELQSMEDIYNESGTRRRSIASKESTIADADMTQSTPIPVGASGFSPNQRRVKHVIAVTATGNKLKKVHVATESGMEVIEVGLKNWESKRLITIQDLRPAYQQINPSLEIFPSSPGTFVINSAMGAELATMSYANSLKLNLQVSPALLPVVSLPISTSAMPTVPTLTRPHRQSLPGRRRSQSVSAYSSLTSINSPVSISPLGSFNLPTGANFGTTASYPTDLDQSPVLSLTGDLPAQKYIMIMKHPNTREQRFFGESGGKTVMRKSVRDVRWMFGVETEECERTWNQVVLAAVVFVAITGGEEGSRS